MGEVHGGRSGRREDAFLDQISELVHRRDRALYWIHRYAEEVPQLETLMRDLELVLTTSEPIVRVTHE